MLVMPAKWIGDAPVFEICKRSAENVKKIDEFKRWIRSCVRPLLPHGALACVHGRTYGVGVSLDYVMTVDYPLGHLQEIRNAAGHMDTPLARSWFEKQEPVFFDASHPSAYVSAVWLASFRKHGLCNAAADGVLDSRRCIATYFSFHQLPMLNETRIRRTFKTLIPLMHETFTRVIHFHQETNTALPYDHMPLTAREREMVMLICKGKSNVEIASLLHLSEFTIRNRVSQILKKTDCRNRSSLVASAMAQHQERIEIGTKIL
ncbi:response regulator transcription factor [Polaromonas sp. YR568]|uniref:helix-turn-helix transcriptional regulator n=1 Tax=Polaromonas sp. YR568 TaxID=1855301 RepID=UPI00398BE999